MKAVVMSGFHAAVCRHGRTANAPESRTEDDTGHGVLTFFFWISALMATQTAMTIRMKTQKIQSAALKPNMNQLLSNQAIAHGSSRDHRNHRPAG
jgi:hypothetical protein